MGSGVFWALLSACGFASLGFFVKELYARGFSSVDALVWRFAVSSALLWVWLLARGRSRIAWRGFLRAFLLGLMGFSTQAALYFSAVSHLSVSLAGLLLYTYPAFVVLIACLWRRPSGREVAGVCLALSGAALVLSPEVGSVAVVGLGLGVVCGVWYATYLTVSERLLAGVDSLLATASVTLGSLVAYLLFASVSRGGVRVPAEAPEWMLLVALAIVATVLPIATLFVAIEKIGASKASLVSTFELVATVAIGFFFAGERLSALQWAGGTAVMGAVVLVARTESSA